MLRTRCFIFGPFLSCPSFPPAVGGGGRAGRVTGGWKRKASLLFGLRHKKTEYGEMEVQGRWGGGARQGLGSEGGRWGEGQLCGTGWREGQSPGQGLGSGHEHGSGQQAFLDTRDQSYLSSVETESQSRLPELTRGLGPLGTLGIGSLTQCTAKQQRMTRSISFTW